MDIAVLEKKALGLSPFERATLADTLLHSLDEDKELEKAWANESEDRLKAYKSGELEALNCSDVISELRSSLA